MFYEQLILIQEILTLASNLNSYIIFNNNRVTKIDLIQKQNFS